MRRAPLILAIAAAACTSELPRGTTSFTLGHTTVRADSALDIIGLVFRLADTVEFPTVGPLPKWRLALSTELGDSALTLARALGPTPVGPILETFAAPDRPDTVCGWLAAGAHQCFSGNAPQKLALRRFIAAAEAFAPRAAPLALEGMDAKSRLQDLSDVYAALAVGRPLDSVIAAYSGYTDLTYDVTLARTFWTRALSPAVDPASPWHAGARRLFLAPDPSFLERSYRSPSYVWLALGHQMTHAVVRRLFAEHPEIVARSVRLQPTVEGDMARAGYAPAIWDIELGEQLARAITVRALSSANRTLTWAARMEALTTNMQLVPWIEDALARYETDRARYPTLSAFAGELADAIAAIPLDSCRAAPSPGAALVGVARGRAVVGWLADRSPFRARGLRVGDTVTTIDGDDVSAGDLLVPTRQLYLDFAQHLPAELATLGVVRGGRSYEVQVPIVWGPRAVARVASQARSVTQRVGGELPICVWVRRALRQ
jgi:hypothetical protein